MQALQGFANAWKIKELRDRILFTLGVLIIYRLGSFIPVPGIDTICSQRIFWQ